MYIITVQLFGAVDPIIDSMDVKLKDKMMVFIH